EQVSRTGALRQWSAGGPSAGGRTTGGWARSTARPMIGPAVAQSPTRSQGSRLSVDAAASADPWPTEVVRVNSASDSLASPEPPSPAVQVISTSALDVPGGGGAHSTIGALLSTRTGPNGPTVVQLPAWSQISAPGISTSPSVSGAIGAAKVRAASAGSTRPDPSSTVVHSTSAFSPTQAGSISPQATLGGLRSERRPVIGPASVQLPAASQT